MSSRPTSKNKERRLWLPLIALALALASWHFFPLPGSLLGSLLLNPLLRGESALRYALERDAPALSADLEAELAALRAENASLRSLSADPEERIAAGVIGRPAALPYDVLFIDKGSEDGAALNAPVFADQDTVIGFVARLYDRSALVVLVSTPGYVSTVYIHGPNIYTSAVGLGGGVTRIHVPQGVALKEGDAVVIPSLSPGVYGAITAVDSVPERPEQYGYVTTNQPISSLRFVAIGRRPLESIGFEAAQAVVEEAKRDFLSVSVPEGILIEAGSELSTSTATSTATSTPAEPAAPAAAESDETR